MYPESPLQEAEQTPGESEPAIEPFGARLAKEGLELSRGLTKTLQVNVGLRCNQECGHCHLEAGPSRKENMDRKTAEEVISYAKRGRFEIIDITGGAPELNSNLALLIERSSSFAQRIMLRSNLSAVNDRKRDSLFDLLIERRVVVVASFPSLNNAQTDSQRGAGTFQMSIEALRKLNSLGYGRSDTGLELNLVSNPAGAFLPSPQSQTEKRFRQVLKDKWGIEFNHLFNFANVPLGRFRNWLLAKGNLEKYMNKIVSSFNPCAAEGLMCRTLISVSWEGFLYDCDFNLARGLHLGGKKTHVSQMEGPPELGEAIAYGDHCYTCTAGSGFT